MVGKRRCKFGKKTRGPQKGRCRERPLVRTRGGIKSSALYGLGKPRKLYGLGKPRKGSKGRKKRR